jgi:hypothetical protein
VHEFLFVIFVFSFLFPFFSFPGSFSSKSTCYIYVSHLEESDEEDEGEEGGETEEKKAEEKMEEGGAEKAAKEEKGEKEKSGMTNIRPPKFICSYRITEALRLIYVDSVEDP